MSDRICPIHGKPIATERDLDSYMADPSRASCRRRGDCDCPECAKVCWEDACKEAVEKETMGGGA